MITTKALTWFGRPMTCRNRNILWKLQQNGLEKEMVHWSGQIVIFPWNRRFPLLNQHFGVRSCEVAIIWPDWCWLHAIAIHNFFGGWPPSNRTKTELTAVKCTPTIVSCGTNVKFLKWHAVILASDEASSKALMMNQQHVSKRFFPTHIKLEFTNK